MEEEHRLLHNLQERVKELTALHQAMRLMQDSTRSLLDVLRDVLALVPPAWQYPEITAARITVNGLEVATPNFVETPWKQSAAIVPPGGQHGIIEVVYLEERPAAVEGPFLAEERHLLNALAESLSLYLDRQQAEKALRGAHERLQALSQQLLHAQEKERRELTRNLQDEIGQALTAVKMNVQTLQRGWGTSAVAPLLEDSLSILDWMLQHVRNLSLDLRPWLLDDFGLVSAVRWYVSRQAERAGWTAEVVADEELSSLPADLGVACYRVVQEAVTNAIRHARGSHIRVSLQRHERDLEILVRDNGVGFHVAEAQARAARGLSLGLLGMEERVHIMNGRLTITSTPGEGTEVLVRIPFGSP